MLLLTAVLIAVKHGQRIYLQIIKHRKQAADVVIIGVGVYHQVQFFNSQTFDVWNNHLFSHHCRVTVQPTCINQYRAVIGANQYRITLPHIQKSRLKITGQLAAVWQQHDNQRCRHQQDQGQHFGRCIGTFIKFKQQSAVLLGVQFIIHLFVYHFVYSPYLYFW